MPAEELKKPDEAAMFRILARHPYSPEGVILRLAWQEGLSRKELNELTWEQVDLDGGSLLLPDRTVPLEPSVADCLRERYAREDSGLCLLHLNTRWQLATKTEWADCIRRLLDSRRAVPLGPAAMETLTVIAYNQPVSRAFIEQVRGVDSSSSVSGLPPSTVNSRQRDRPKLSFTVSRSRAICALESVVGVPPPM